MYRFSTKQSKKVVFKVHERGITLLYFATNGEAGDVFQVGQSWSNIHALVSKLRNRQKYSAEDHSLSAWKQGEELHIRLNVLDLPLEETLTFSRETTGKILAALEGLPSLN